MQSSETPHPLGSIELGPATGGISVCAGDVELYKGQPGRDGRKRAVQIVEEVER